MKSFIKMAIAGLIILAFVSTVFAQAETAKETPKKVKKEVKKVEAISLLAPAKLDPAKTYWSIKKDAWIKETGSSEGKQLAKLATGSILSEVGKEGRWIKLEGMKADSTKIMGFVYRNFLDKYPPVEKKVTPKKPKKEAKPADTEGTE